MKDIIFVNLPASYLVDPKADHGLAIPCLVSYLREKSFDVGVRDLADSISVTDFNIDPARFYGISFTSASRSMAISCVQHLRKIMPSSKIIGGGFDLTACPNKTERYFDFVVIGEGEKALFDLLSGGFRTGKKFWQADNACNLSELPSPAYEYFWDYKEMTLLTVRGCPYRCTFCAQHIMWPKIRYFPLEYIRKSASQLRNRRVNLMDDTVNTRPQRLLKISDILSTFGISWHCQARAGMKGDCVNFWKNLRENGCDLVALGLESGSQRILNKMDKKLSIDDYFKTVEILKEAGISIKLNVLLFFPGETEEDREKTKAFVRWAQPDKLELNFFVPFPGCDVWKNPTKYYGNEGKMIVDSTEQHTFSNKETWKLKEYWIKELELKE